MKSKFEVVLLCSSRFSNSNANIISRLLNTLAQAINERKKLPRYVVVILDNDLIKFLDYAEFGIASIFREGLEFLMEQFQQMFTDKKDLLPAKAVIPNFPCIYWVTAPRHKYFKDNPSHTKFNQALESVVKLLPNMRLVKMKEIWNYDNRNLVDPPAGCIIFEGLSLYWSSVDAAVKFNIDKHEMFHQRHGNTDANVSNNTSKKNQQMDKMHDFFRRNKQQDKYHWTRPATDNQFKKLPNPYNKKFQ